jgi:polyisoprenyl-teichoic acid--peptidoglycan teichoic acid transferase
MRILKFDKSSILLLVILVLVVGAVVAIFMFAGEQEVDKNAVRTYLFVLEDSGKPVETEVFFFYNPSPQVRQAALLYVPQSTAQIIKGKDSGDRGKYDRIDSIYDPNNVGPFKAQIETLIGKKIDSTVKLDLDSLSRFADLLGEPGQATDALNLAAKSGGKDPAKDDSLLMGESGLFFFSGNDVEQLSKDDVILLDMPSNFDGAKLRLYAHYSLPGEDPSFAQDRRRDVMLRVYKAFSQRGDYLLGAKVFPTMSRQFKTDLSSGDLGALIRGLGGVNVDLLPKLWVRGTTKTVDGKTMLFPWTDVNDVKRMVSQVLEGLKNAKSEFSGQSIPVVIYNGTKTRDLARSVKILYSDTSRYDVQFIDNWQDMNLERTEVLDKMGNPDAAKEVAAVIGCTNIVYQDDTEGSLTSSDDNTIVIKIGKDFRNGKVSQ